MSKVTIPILDLKNPEKTQQELLATLKEAEKLKDILGMHFCYNHLILLYYRYRKNPKSLEYAKHYCLLQIKIAPQAAKEFTRESKWKPLPAHAGYHKLSLILEKEGKLEEALQVALKGRNEAWGRASGDQNVFAKRVETLQRKLKIID